MGYAPAPDDDKVPKRRMPIWVNAGLFLLTLLSTTIAGAAWVGVNPYEITNWGHGITYAVLLMTFLSAHEFGHYIAARRHGVDASLPFFIPVPPMLLPFGTMGALIRLRSRIPTRAALFDIGVSGPLAGFVVCLFILVIGFQTLPPIDYLNAIHPEGLSSGGMYFGDTVLFSFMRNVFTSNSGTGFMPPMNEIYHYPFLCVGWFGLFVTALNMLPFGQLDGGHVLYALTGRVQHVVGRVGWWLLFTMGFLSLLGEFGLFLAQPSPSGFVNALQNSIGGPLLSAIHMAPWLFEFGTNWLLWAVLVRFLIGVYHPPIEDETPLSAGRQIVGWLSIIILVLSFSPNSVYFVQ
ncbi:MAG: site-2 protease family protein [bacterium]|nr:site-2 protease family protein [bacterium]